MSHPDPDLLALAALPSEQRDPAVEQHLAHCPMCHGHVESLRRTVELAVAGGTGGADEDPPDSIWTAIAGELAITDTPPARWRRFAVPVAAAVLSLFVGLGVGLAVAGAPPAEQPLARLAPLAQEGASGASGTAALAERDGVREVVVRIEGVTAPAGSDFLEAWLMDASGTRLVSLGALAPDGDGFRGTFTVPSNLPMAEFGTVDVSAERWDGDATHSSDSLLRGTVA